MRRSSLATHPFWDGIVYRIRGCCPRLHWRIRERPVPRLAIAGMNRTPDTPYRLLWVPGTAAVLLCIAAFVLWGLGGAGVLSDIIVAFCT